MAVNLLLWFCLCDATPKGTFSSGNSESSVPVRNEESVSACMASAVKI